METVKRTNITVEATVNATIEKVWEMWNNPKHITQWCAASDDWHAPSAENNFVVGGKSKTRMEAKDGSFGFDFGWTYTKIKGHQTIEYIMDDGRKAAIKFETRGDGVTITETFEAEDTNPVEMQRGGWQAILNNFKKYVEQN